MIGARDRGRARAGGDGPPRTALIVDDDLSVRAGLGPVLETEGMEVTTAASLAEAETILRVRCFDLVITDLRLEGADGRQGLDVVSRARECSPHIHIVLFTAHGGPQVREEAIRRGALDMWEKSMPIPEMIRRMRELGFR